MEWLGVIGILVGLVFFVIAAMKGWNVLVTSIVTAVIIAATIGGALPNSGAMFGMLAAMGLNHGNSYKHIAAISIGAGMCALVVMIVLANLGIA